MTHAYTRYELRYTKELFLIFIFFPANLICADSPHRPIGTSGCYLCEFYETWPQTFIPTLLSTVANAFQFASIIHWISLIILSLFFSEVRHVYQCPLSSHSSSTLLKPQYHCLQNPQDCNKLDDIHDLILIELILAPPKACSCLSSPI